MSGRGGINRSQSRQIEAAVAGIEVVGARDPQHLQQRIGR